VKSSFLNSEKTFLQCEKFLPRQLVSNGAGSVFPLHSLTTKNQIIIYNAFHIASAEKAVGTTAFTTRPDLARADGREVKLNN